MLKMQKVLNVIKTVIILAFLILYASCKVTKRVNIIEEGTYSLKRYTSKSGFSSINVKAYDFEYKNDLNAGLTINNIYYDLNFNKEKEIVPLHIVASPKNKFNVRFFFPSRYSVNVKEFTLNPGDSIVIKAYLKEDNRPVY